MRLRLRAGLTMAGPQGSVRGGEVFETDAREGAELVAMGVAISLEPAAAAHAPEAAAADVTMKRRGRK